MDGWLEDKKDGWMDGLMDSLHVRLFEPIFIKNLNLNVLKFREK